MWNCRRLGSWGDLPSWWSATVQVLHWRRSFSGCSQEWGDKFKEVRSAEEVPRAGEEGDLQPQKRCP